MWIGTISSLTIGFVAFQNLFLERACTVDLDHSIDLCFHSNETVKREIEVIQFTYLYTQNLYYQILIVKKPDGKSKNCVFFINRK